MEKIDIEKIIAGRKIYPNNTETGTYFEPHEYTHDSLKVVAEKINEIVDFLNFIGTQEGNGGENYIEKFNQMKQN